jgi:hypothetical protein
VLLSSQLHNLGVDASIPSSWIALASKSAFFASEEIRKLEKIMLPNKIMRSVAYCTDLVEYAVLKVY